MAKKISAILVVLAAFCGGTLTGILAEAKRIETVILAVNASVAEDGPEGRTVTDEELKAIVEPASQLWVARWIRLRTSK